jgi:mannitol/fructose-specific phosphotransferase system IIA component (Ntr-type)
MPVTKIIDYLRPEHCMPALEGSTREDVIEEIANQFVASGTIGEGERDMLLETVFDREAAATTGIGNGIALPHPKSVQDVAFLDTVLIGVGLCSAGVDFRSLDNAPVDTVFLVASPDNVDYLEVAKRIAALAKAGSRADMWRRVIRQSSTPEAVREALQDAWEELAP